MEQQLSFISLGGMGNVTRNMYIYQYGNEILLVDCGLGFADETMLGVDFLLPDITYLLQLLQEGKKIAGMVITHGHEDHMGALPFILTQLPLFPVYATPFSAALANEKLNQFGLQGCVEEKPFNQEIPIGSFTASFISVTHSIPDTSHIFIKTPVGNFYHGSDFKFDLTPVDKKQTDFAGIVQAGSQGIRCLLSECLGADREGYTRSEASLFVPFEEEILHCKGKCIVTTYSSNISRLNQISGIAARLGRKICFAGRSLIKAKEVARKKGLFALKEDQEISVDQLSKYKDSEILLFVAGSQGQENSALTRIINGEHKDIRLEKNDVVIFSADPIPGNEISIYALVDSLSKMGIKVLYSDSARHFHVSGHGSSQELLLLLSLLKPRQVLPISGNYRHMAAYKRLAKQYGYFEKDIIMLSGGQEVIFTEEETKLGQKIPIRQVYVDEVSGEEIEHFVLRDRQKISQEGMVAIIVEIDGENGKLAARPDVIARGFSLREAKDIEKIISGSLQTLLNGKKPVADWMYVRKQIRETAEKKLFHELKRRPLVLPVVIEV